MRRLGQGRDRHKYLFRRFREKLSYKVGGAGDLGRAALTAPARYSVARPSLSPFRDRRPMDETESRDIREPAALVVRETCRIIEPPFLEEMGLERRLSDAESSALKKRAADFEAFVRTGNPPPGDDSP